MSRSYQDFEPDCQYKKGEADDIVIEFQVKDFKKDQLKVHLGSNGILTVSGERPVGGTRWVRFRKEFNSPKDCKANEIRARFSSGILYITIPNKITSQVPQQDPLTPVQQATSSPIQDEGKLQQETSSQSKEAASEAFTANLQSGAGDAMTTPTENAAILPEARPELLISRLKVERKIAAMKVAEIVMLSLLFITMLFYVFKFYDPMIMNL